MIVKRILLDKHLNYNKSEFLVNIEIIGYGDENQFKNNNERERDKSKIWWPKRVKLIKKCYKN